ncbi:hypothetical protein TBK1r_62260 [Stieleria magnilauensis]|uniref:Coat protein n=1 Tax=Stieleria magnilauensis TaxID=2527963 RepID=A0ABX5Y085_9BACT|nr:hypothetical protein TBK1r_62260 [Planctomycetes bacterium TBK1r]
MIAATVSGRALKRKQNVPRSRSSIRTRPSRTNRSSPGSKTLARTGRIRSNRVRSPAQVKVDKVLAPLLPPFLRTCGKIAIRSSSRVTDATIYYVASSEVYRKGVGRAAVRAYRRPARGRRRCSREIRCIKQETYNQFSMVAFDHALGFGPEDSFERRFAEPWLLAGHLPCGWKGKVPREPKRWSDVSLDDVVGDGKLVVF